MKPMVSGRTLRAGTGTGYDRVCAGGTVVPVVPIKLYPKKVTKLTKKVTDFSKLVTFLSKLVTFFLGTDDGYNWYNSGGNECTLPYPESVPTVP